MFESDHSCIIFHLILVEFAGIPVTLAERVADSSAIEML